MKTAGTIKVTSDSVGVFRSGSKLDVYLEPW